MKECDKQNPPAWEWELTDWSRRLIKANAVLAAGAIGAIAIGIARKDVNLLRLGLYVGAFAIPATLLLGMKEVIEANHRAKLGIIRPPKQTKIE